MHRVIDIALTGHAHPFHVHDDGYAALRDYLDAAAARLGDDTDAQEVVDDLERSIGDRLAAIAGPEGRIISAADVTSVLAEVGRVEAPSTGIAPGSTGPRPTRRKLYRIRKGQDIAGVCNGLAVYSDVGVDWVRWIFFFGAIFSGGILVVVYVVMMFVLPVVDTPEEWRLAMSRAEP